MPTYNVLVADRTTGRESTLIVEAADRHDAIAKVQDGDTVVGKVVEVEPPPSPQENVRPSEPIEQLLAEVRELRRELTGKVAKGLLLGLLAWLGLAVVVAFLYGVVAGI